MPFRRQPQCSYHVSAADVLSLLLLPSHLFQLYWLYADTWDRLATLPRLSLFGHTRRAGPAPTNAVTNWCLKRPVHIRTMQELRRRKKHRFISCLRVFSSISFCFFLCIFPFLYPHLLLFLFHLFSFILSSFPYSPFFLSSFFQFLFASLFFLSIVFFKLSLLSPSSSSLFFCSFYTPPIYSFHTSVLVHAYQHSCCSECDGTALATNTVLSYSCTVPHSADIRVIVCSLLLFSLLTCNLLFKPSKVLNCKTFSTSSVYAHYMFRPTMVIFTVPLKLLMRLIFFCT
jgi:hypothetical protein